MITVNVTNPFCKSRSVGLFIFLFWGLFTAITCMLLRQFKVHSSRKVEKSNLKCSKSFNWH